MDCCVATDVFVMKGVTGGKNVIFLSSFTGFQLIYVKLDYLFDGTDRRRKTMIYEGLALYQSFSAKCN